MLRKSILALTLASLTVPAMADDSTAMDVPDGFTEEDAADADCALFIAATGADSEEGTQEESDAMMLMTYFFGKVIGRNPAGDISPLFTAERAAAVEGRMDELGLSCGTEMMNLGEMMMELGSALEAAEAGADAAEAAADSDSM